MTTTLRQWFANFTQRTGETPTHIVLGNIGWYCSDEDSKAFGEYDRNVVMTWDAVSDAVLDKQFDDGYGGNNSPDLCAWSESWVLFNDDYDGAESLCWVPRSPVDHKPTRPGGG